MAFRGRGRGRDGFGRGHWHAEQEPFELFPEIEGLGTAEYSDKNLPLVKWSISLQRFCSSSPYCYEDRRQQKAQKTDIERYADKNSRAKKAKPKLSEIMMLGSDHMPGELARAGEKENRVFKKVQWNPDSGWQKLDIFEKLEQKNQGTVKKENEDEEDEENEEEAEEDGEFSDDGDYKQGEYFDDDEDDFNIADDNDDEAFY